jgi:hypothetical protein
MIRTSLNTDSDDSLPTVLIALDVDGVLNRIPESRVAPVDAVWIVRRNGEGYWIDAPHDVLKALDGQLRRPGVQLGWLTTWGDDVDLLVEGAFAGLLAGGNVIASRPDEIFVPIDWKLRALLEHLDQIGNPSYVWADDDAVAEALLFRPSFADSSGRGGGPRLLIDTAPQTGLTMSDVDRIRAFIDTHS